MFDVVAGKRLANMLYKYRKAVTSAGLRIEQGAQKCPRHIRAPVWESLCQIWKNEDWQRRSEAARGNRLLKPEANIHTGGSIRFDEHRRRMEENEGGPVDYRAVFEATHKSRKTNDMVTPSAHRLLMLIMRG